MNTANHEPGRPAESAAELLDIEAIKQLKHAYFRLLDLKEFEALGTLFADDATTSYESGKFSHSGRDEAISFLSKSLGDPSIVHEHLGHHPEITLTSDTTAVGTWYLHDRVMVPSVDFELGGTAIYTDEYVKADGVWLIRHTGYVRVYEEKRMHSTGALVAFRSRFDADDASAQAGETH
jgi:pterin-4a-carbinolamine dehydratase